MSPLTRERRLDAAAGIRGRASFDAVVARSKSRRVFFLLIFCARVCVCAHINDEIFNVVDLDKDNVIVATIVIGPIKNTLTSRLSKLYCLVRPRHRNWNSLMRLLIELGFRHSGRANIVLRC